MKRNWNAIRQLSCRPTQIALATCSDSEVLPRLQQAFPECFEEGEEVAIPWTRIEQRTREYLRDHYDDRRGRFLYTELYFPNRDEFPFVLYFGKSPGEKDLETDGAIPKEILDQLDNVPSEHHLANPTRPMLIRYQDKEWVVVLMDRNGCGEFPDKEGNGRV